MQDHSTAMRPRASFFPFGVWHVLQSPSVCSEIIATSVRAVAVVGLVG
jgi:hypothetical protein